MIIVIVIGINMFDNISFSVDDFAAYDIPARDTYYEPTNRFSVDHFLFTYMLFNIDLYIIC